MFALSRWQWVTDEAEEGMWDMPGADARLDLRPLASCGQQGGIGGWGLGHYSGDPSGLPGVTVLLGDDPAGIVNAQARQDVRDILGKNLTSPRLDDLVWEMQTEAAEIEQIGFIGPLMPGTKRPGLRLGFSSIQRSEAFDLLESPHSAKVLAVYQKTYAERRTDALGIAGAAPDLRSALLDRGAADPAEGHLRYLDIVLKKHPELRGRYELVQGDLAALGGEPRPHNTTATDSFDSGSWPDMDLSWDVLIGSFGGTLTTIRVNTNGGAGARARARVDLDGDDNYAQADVEEISAGLGLAGPCARYQRLSDTCYCLVLNSIASPENATVSKIVASAVTALGTSPSFSISPPHMLRLEVDGSTLSPTVDSAPTESDITDGSVATGTRGGVRGIRNSLGAVTRLDNFEIGDLAGGVAPTGQHYPAALIAGL